ncbi:hypothetical protein DL765_009778 [Monosporascus sp. GIB2]|nr:hypothetical protein DL765_009778 [Monosporascus sp. GIB2]
MKITSLQAAMGSAVVLLSTPIVATVQHRHRHLHQKLAHAHSSSSYNEKYSARNISELEKRGNRACPFPKDKGLVAVTPGAKNAGWAMAPDQECVEGTWCPIACPPGQVMNQWKPQTTYAFPESTFGGVYCGEGGKLEFPFKDEPCCVDGTGAVDVVNKCGDVVSFCQTVLPGYEDMIIPTDVYDTATIAVPDDKYWAGTAAHYYINAPGVDSSKGCIWGDSSTPIGNWSPYVAGANTVSGGTTFVKVGLNPVWEESALSSTKPDFGLEIECPDGGCTGLPCKVDGSGVVSNNKAKGAGGSPFCVVTVAKGSKANIIVSYLNGSGGDDSEPSSTAVESTTSTPTPSSTSTTTSTPTPTPTSTSTSTSSSSSSSSPPPTPSSTTTSTTSTASTTSATSTTSSTPLSTSSSSTPTMSSSPSSSETTSSESISSTSSSTSTSSTFLGGIFQENRTTSSFGWTSPTLSSGHADLSTTDAQVEPAPSETNSNENAAQNRGGAAMAGLIVALVAAGCLL